MQDVALVPIKLHNKWADSAIPFSAYLAAVEPFLRALLKEGVPASDISVFGSPTNHGTINWRAFPAPKSIQRLLSAGVKEAFDGTVDAKTFHGVRGNMYARRVRVKLEALRLCCGSGGLQGLAEERAVGHLRLSYSCRAAASGLNPLSAMLLMKHDSVHRAALYMNTTLTDNVKSTVKLTGNALHNPVPVLHVPVKPYTTVTVLDAPGALGCITGPKYDLAFNFAQVILHDATGGKVFPRTSTDWAEKLRYLYDIFEDVRTGRGHVVAYLPVLHCVRQHCRFPLFANKKYCHACLKARQ